MENILQAFTSLLANKTRALLTMLGIIIGIGSVIAIFTLGDSLTGSLTSQMSSFGVNNVTISLQQTGESSLQNLRGSMLGYGGGGGIAEKDLIKESMLTELKNAFPDEIAAVALTDSVGSGKTAQGRNYANLSLTGVNPDYFLVSDPDLLYGRLIGQRDMEGLRKVAMVSDKLVKNMFGGEKPLGKQITITAGNHVDSYTIVGVYKHEASPLIPNTASDKDISTAVYIPLSTAMRVTGTTGFQSLTLMTAGGVDSVAFAETAGNYLGRFYSRNLDYRVSAFSMESMLSTMTDMLNTVSVAIAAIAAISLLVGGIGVMNIMLVSITERTREIGTRKAIGATNGQIRIQFIVESMVICLVGGLIGMMLGIALGAGGAALLGTPARPSPMMMLGTALFSMAIGVFFGYYPANKAAKLDPIEALRYE
ncbi:MAG: ABC transporter permease [Christensenellaceae bacterium]|jgi:putative ABC transport system permease protein|nr:ABC transporter permease [Christensenellaceae bacterium]